MGKLKYLVIHCTATPEGREVGRKDIIRWHKKERGWSRVGYSDLIALDGTLVNLHPFNTDDQVDTWEVTNGAKGYNGKARHIVYVGGWSSFDNSPKDTRTPKQTQALETYVRYMILRYPGIKIIGHCEISQKTCPNFDVKDWLESIGINSKNIGL